jgi:hypothetical protein
MVRVPALQKGKGTEIETPWNKMGSMTLGKMPLARMTLSKLTLGKMPLR